MSRHLRLVIRVAASLGMVGLVLWWVDLGRLGEVLRRTSVMLALVVVLLHTGDRLLMALKWRLLLVGKGLRLSSGDAIRAYYVSSFAGIFLPMTVGADAVRIAALRSKRSRVPMGSLVASIALERGIGALSQGVFVLFAIGAILVLQLDMRISLRLLAGTALGVILALSAALPLSFRLARAAGEHLGRGGGLRAKIGALALEYASWRRHPGLLWGFLLLTFVEGFFPIVTYWAAAAAVGAPFTLVHMVATVPIVYLLARLPVSVAGIGAEQASFVAACALLGLAEEPAAAVTFLVSPITLIIALLPGAVAYLMTPAAPPLEVPIAGDDEGGTPPP